VRLWLLSHAGAWERSNHAPEKLGRRYGWLAALYLLLLLSCLFGIGWALGLPHS
jgi:hypothetical protein